MDFKKYGIIYILLFIVIVLFILTRLFPGMTIYDLGKLKLRGSPSPSAELSITVQINLGEEEKVYSGIEASNVYLALVEAGKQEDLKLETSQGSFGVVVEQIGEIKNTESMAWTFSVNGESSNIRADEFKLEPGDKVEWIYQPRT